MSAQGTLPPIWPGGWRCAQRRTPTARRDVYLDLQERRALVSKAPADLTALLRGLSLVPLRPGALAALTVGSYDKRRGVAPSTTAYALRHSVITDLVTGGLDLLTVAQISGTSVVMIERHYGHLRADHAAAALAALAV
jgi:site-specific recombinase XerD